MKKLLFLLPLALLCGCAREPSPVSALALDRAGSGCRLTAELVRQDTPEDAAVPSCLAAQGDSFTDALHALEGLLPGELYLSHAQVLLLSEQAAEDDLTPLAEYLCRDNDIRLNLRCAVVRGGAASDLLENDEEVYALSGLNVCAMWALPAVFLAGAVAVLSGVLTAGELRLSRLAAPTAALLPQFWSLLRLLLPGALILALSLRDSSLAGAASRGLTAGGALLALLSLRTVLLLGPHTAALLPYPNFSAAGLAAIGDFARHGEVFFTVPLILCETGRCAALMSVILRVLPKRRS